MVLHSGVAQCWGCPLLLLVNNQWLLLQSPISIFLSLLTALHHGATDVYVPLLLQVVDCYSPHIFSFHSLWLPAIIICLLHCMAVSSMLTYTAQLLCPVKRHTPPLTVVTFHTSTFSPLISPWQPLLFPGGWLSAIHVFSCHFAMTTCHCVSCCTAQWCCQPCWCHSTVASWIPPLHAALCSTLPVTSHCTSPWHCWCLHFFWQLLGCVSHFFLCHLLWPPAAVVCWLHCTVVSLCNADASQLLHLVKNPPPFSCHLASTLSPLTSLWHGMADANMPPLVASGWLLLFYIFCLVVCIGHYCLHCSVIDADDTPLFLVHHSPFQLSLSFCHTLSCLLHGTACIFANLMMATCTQWRW